jgi:hypothetical protein
MFGHCFLRLIFVGTRSNASPIGKHEPMMKANFPDDVLGHFSSVPGSEQIPSYDSSVAGTLTPTRGE